MKHRSGKNFLKIILFSHSLFIVTLRENHKKPYKEKYFVELTSAEGVIMVN